ncbi:uncharacterized protein [Phaseolus vulgaris]|uniref:uncharacterized protein n=1 Tax=Phaseolus vulgaris TaxID=3885 RepID=UPI0035CA393F
MQAQTLQALETKATILEEEMRTLGRQNEAYQTSLKQMQESKAETERQLEEALELQAGLYTREVALQVQVTGLQELLKADAEIQKDLKDRCREQADKTERLEGEMVTQAKAMDLLRADYDKLQVKVSRLRVEKEALEKQAQEINKKLKRQVEELEQQNQGLKEQTEELKKQIEELNLSFAQILAAEFEATREQFPCLFPNLDLSMVSLNNELVDGKVVPAED